MANGLRVVHLISGLGLGGAETVLYRLVTTAKRDKHIVVSMQSLGVIGERLQAAGIEVHALAMRTDLRLFMDFWRLRALLKQLQPDVVQTWMYHADIIGGLAARLAGIRTVVWGIRNSGEQLAQSSRSAYYLARVGGWLSHVLPRRIICCAELACQRHLRWGYDERKMRVIANGYDLSRWRPNPSARQQKREQLGLGDETPLLAFVARWNPLKDHKSLLQAFSLVLKEFNAAQHLSATQFALQQPQQPPPQLLLIGHDMDASNTVLMDWIERYRLHDYVHLLGRRDDVPDWMAAIDFHVLSSKAEGFPNVVAEAMACEVPCVVTDVGDAALIVGEYGWVAPPEDPRALARAMMEALATLAALATNDAPTVEGQSFVSSRDHSSSDELRQLKQHCRQRVLQEFSLTRMVARYEAVWQEAVEASR